jgi:choline dehydrogenase-like flavoprotein
MELTRRQRRALEAICETFAPGSVEQGVPAAFLAAADRARPAERRQLGLLLAAWELVNPGFSGSSRERRERVLRSWCDSVVPRKRSAFAALRKGVLLHSLLLPSPLWEEMGYPGTRPAAEPVAPVLTATPAADLDCDVCVVGSGAGGGVAAAVLAEAGLDVVVLEAGGHYDGADFSGGEYEGWERLYLQGGAAATDDGALGLLAGACLGGGTTVNYTTSFRTPDEVRAEWASHGVPAFAGAEYDRSLDAVWSRLGVNVDHNRPSRRDEVMRRGLEALGWHVDAMPRNVAGCTQDELCGFCGFGCPIGAKQSTARTWLADAQARGARLVTRTTAERVLLDRGAARGVAARAEDGRPVTVRCRAVVAAAGAIGTPALLLRTGLAGANVGAHLRLHPGTGVIGRFEEEVRPWEGTLQALYSDQHRDLDEGYGVKYETVPVHPSLAGAFAPWRGAAEFRDLVRRLARSSAVGILLRDRGAGRVTVDRDGRAVVRYRLSDYDAAHVHRGVEGAARILEAAGALELHSAHARGVSCRRGGVERFVQDAAAAGYGPNRCVFYSFHIMGSARMTGSPATGACTPEGETWAARDLWVCDGSAFPTAPGVNPMVSIEAVAHLNARALAARLA